MKFALIQDGIIGAVAFAESIELAIIDYRSFEIVEIPEDSKADVDWLYDDESGFTPPEDYESIVNPNWEGFVLYFSIPGQGGHALYQSILAKVVESGAIALDHWANFKLAFQNRNTDIFAASVQYLNNLLDTANQSLSEGDIESWNSLMSEYDFPESCCL